MFFSASNIITIAFVKPKYHLSVPHPLITLKWKQGLLELYKRLRFSGKTRLLTAQRPKSYVDLKVDSCSDVALLY